MPLPYKIVLSLIVLVIGGIVAWTEFAKARPDLGWLVLSIVAIMLLGQWVFPEAGGGKPKNSVTNTKS